MPEVLVKYKKYIAFALVSLTAFSKLSLFAVEKADYIVVGVGTAGATIAKLLSDDKKTSVIALHNGKNLTNDPDIKYTQNTLFTVVSAMFGSPFYQTGFSIPQTNDDDRELFWALAVPEGGASSINAGAWARGTDQVYSQWEAVAGPEWSTSRILDIYKGLEKYSGTTPNPAARGFHGPLNIRQNPAPTRVMFKFAQAISAATGVPIIIDYNDPATPLGASPQMQYTQKGSNGQFRVSSATAFLNKGVVNSDGKGVDGRKLTVKFKSPALRTIWKGNKAIGVEYFNKGKIHKVYAKKGVIVCAGLYSSAFLMHSGVGSKKELKRLGIKVKYDNPHVGQSLADQVLSVVAFSSNPEDTPVSTKTGCSGKLPVSVIASQIEKIPFADPKEKDLLLNAIFCSDFAFPANSIFGQIANLPAPGGDPSVRKVRLTTTNPVPGVTFALFDLVQPESRGRITLSSFNPFIPPVIDNGIFSNPADLTLYVQAYQIYLKNISNALNAIDPAYKLIYPPLELLDDTELLTTFIKEAAMSNQCWQSHCRMAPLDQGGVVDSSGKVYGLENLFVADDSIVPIGMDGTPMASAYLIAANIARLLLER